VGRFNYARGDGVQVIELPYRGDLSMVVVLPDGADDLPAVERKLALNYPGWVAALRPDDVDLWLPRWTIECWLDLGGPIQETGMRLALTRAADFSGMSDVPLFIGKVVHQAFIDVTETGTEAAAATAEGLTTGRYAPPTVFHADHPFLYLICDRKTGAVLFLGRVTGVGA
jgi:serpin B